jgi:dihydrofolate reductase/thymidylate synthase
VFVIGGAQVYAEALASPQCEAVHLTEVAGVEGAAFKCDAFLPAIDAAKFKLYAAAPVVGRCRLKLVETSVESTWFQRLKL